MLEKIEAAYLAAMRVIVLVAATLALAASVIGMAVAAPQLARLFGSTSAPPAELEPISLGVFIQEQAASQETEEGEEALGPAMPGEIVRASTIIAEYARVRLKADVGAGAIQEALMAKREDIGPEHRAEYDASLLKLCEQLKASTGKPLSPGRIDQLLNWHIAEFQLGVLKREDDAAAADARGKLGLAVAVGSLLSFVVILFFFLFVKIERNLRLVRTKEVAAP